MNTEYAEKITHALELKKLHDAEIIVDGDGHERPKSRGRLYTECIGHDIVVDQTGKEQADINFIMRRIQKTGQLADLIAQGMQSQNGMMYGDFTDAPTFQEAMNITLHARDQFSRLDAHIRNRFDNDPAKFLDFVHDPKNAEEMLNMGLRKPKPPEPEPDAKLKDVVDAIKGTAKPSKKAPKGESEDE